MPLGPRVLILLALPTAMAFVVTLLWVKTKQKSTPKKKAKPIERSFDSIMAEATNNSDQQKGLESSPIRVGETEREIDMPKERKESVDGTEDGEDAETNDLEALTMADLNRVESPGKDSGVGTKTPSLLERNDSFVGEETTSEGSVDSSTLLAFTEARSYDGSPPLNDNGKTRNDLPNNERDVWEIEFPQILCGRLIGRKGKNVRVISDNSGAKIRLIPQSPGEVATHRIISVTGTSQQIEAALEAIHEKFPCVPLTRLNPPKTQNGIKQIAIAQTGPQFVQTVLPSMETFNVIVTSVLDAGHFFAQVNTDDYSLGQLQELHQKMLHYYSQGNSAYVPALPQPIVLGCYCAAPAFSYGGWYRAQVLQPTGNQDEVQIFYMDYGGYAQISISLLRQLR